MPSDCTTKILVRLLPPEITEEELFSTISDDHQQNVVWKSFAAGKRFKGDAKAARNATCCMQFGTLEAAERFVKDYHGHKFVDGRGEEFRAVTCFAPYQKVPRQRSQKDPREGTIQDDATYKEFVTNLTAAKGPYEAPPDPKTLLRPSNPKDTPLLNFILKRATERKERAEKMREKKKNSRWGLETVDEDYSKKSKWHCAECYTSKHLEEDPDARGTFYCTYCWESFETNAASKKKKKKKSSKEEEVVETEKEKKARKKREKKEREAAKWNEDTEWYAKETKNKSTEEEADGKKSKKKKKKEKEEEDYWKESSWAVSSKHKSKKEKDDSWWEQPDAEKHKRWDGKSDKWEKPEDVKGSKWKAKAPAAGDGGEEKPRKSKKDKKHGEDDSGSSWRAK